MQIVNRSAPPGSRRGIATIWVLLLLPVIGLLLIVVADLATLWLAKQELITAVEAAALSGVKTWGEGGSTTQARADTGQIFAVNDFVGLTSTLNTANGAGINGNGASTEIILGGILVSNNGNLTFDCNRVPCSSFIARISVDTFTPDSPGDHTFRSTDAFRVDSFTSPDPGARLEQVIFEIPPGDANAYFDLRPFGVGNDSAEGRLPSILISVGPVGTTVVPSVPFLSQRFKVMTATFPGAGEPPGTNLLRFGVDTDFVGQAPGDSGTAIDAGGRFGIGPLVNRTLVTVVVNGQSYSGRLARVAGNGLRSEVEITGTLGTPHRGVWVRKTVTSIPSLCNGYLGFNFGSYSMSAQAVARYRCGSGPPELVVIETFNCP